MANQDLTPIVEMNDAELIRKIRATAAELEMLDRQLTFKVSRAMAIAQQREPVLVVSEMCDAVEEHSAAIDKYFRSHDLPFQTLLSTLLFLTKFNLGHSADVAEKHVLSGVN